MTEAGALLLGRILSGFRTQGRTVPWARRMTPNVPAVVESLNKGATPKQRHLRPHRALYDTGNLYRSIALRVTKDSVSIGTSVPYAETMQFGGTTRHSLTPTGRSALTSFLRSAGGVEYREMLGWLFSQPDFEVEVAAREFIEITDQDKADVARIVETWVEERVSRGSA
jgi:phage gpG-like protein